MSKVEKINIKSWYIVDNKLNGDVFKNNFYQFKQFNIVKYEQSTNKIWLTIAETTAEVNQELKPDDSKNQIKLGMTDEKGNFVMQVYGTILDWSLIDKWFITNKKVDKFKEILTIYQ